MATKKSNKTKRTRPYTEPFAAYAAKNGKYITTMTYGGDKNKVNQAGNPVTRGENTYVARQCSNHVRTVYPQTILQDHDANDQNGEFCVNGRTDEYVNNECKLCGIETCEKWEKQKSINIAEAVGGKLPKMIYFFGSNYPNKKNYTILRIKKNGVVIIKYYIKLIPYSSLIKTSAPSGYKYKDRASLSKFIKIQSNAHKDVIFCISSDEVHSVGFWNLLKDGGIRKMIQLQQEKSLDACFYLLIDKQSTDVQTIDVELMVNRHDMKNKKKSLWHWDRNNKNNINNMSVSNHGSTQNSASINNSNNMSPSLPLPPMSLPSNKNPNFNKNPMPFINNYDETPNINPHILNPFNPNNNKQHQQQPQQTQYMNMVNNSPMSQQFNAQQFQFPLMDNNSSSDFDNKNSDINDDDHSLQNNDIAMISNSPSVGGYSCDSSNNFKKKCRRKGKKRLSTFQCTNSSKKYDNDKKDADRNSKKLNRQNKIDEKAGFVRKCCNNNEFYMSQIMDNSIVSNVCHSMSHNDNNNNNNRNILTGSFSTHNQIICMQKEMNDLKNQIQELRFRLAQQKTHNHNPIPPPQNQRYNNGPPPNNQQYNPQSFYNQQGNPQFQQQFQQFQQQFQQFQQQLQSFYEQAPPQVINSKNQMSIIQQCIQQTGINDNGQSQQQNNNNPYNNQYGNQPNEQMYQPQHHGHATSSNPSGLCNPMPQPQIQQPQIQQPQIQQPPKPPAPIINDIEELLFADGPTLNNNPFSFDPNQSTVNMFLNESVDPFSTFNTNNSTLSVNMEENTY